MDNSESHPNANRLTGQLLFRKASDHGCEHQSAPDGSDRKLMMMVGIVAVPPDFPLEDECLYTVASHSPDIFTIFSGLDLSNAVKFSVYPESKQDLPEQIKNGGFSADGLLTSGIWRC